MLGIATDVAHSMVSLLVMAFSLAKTAELIEMPFGGRLAWRHEPKGPCIR